MGISLSENYRSKYLKYDLIAGLTVAVMLVPQGMAYAVLAGLPPIYGLYAALVPLLIYPFFGSSNFLSVGPVALVSILVLSGLSFFAEPMSVEFIQLAILTSLIAGILQVLMSLLRLGFLVNFLSHPVISGFTSAAAFIIAFSQLNHIFGVEIPRATNFIVTIVNLIKEIPNFSLTPALIGLGGLAIIMVLKKLKRSFPSALLVVVLSIIIVRIFQLDTHGLSIVGNVPSGFPSFEMPEITLQTLLKVTPVALIICLISFIESLAIAKTLAARHGKFDIDSNKELMGLGLAKIIGSFFQAFPNTGSFTRSAINEQSGARTGLASIFASMFIGLTLLLFTDFFYYLPNAILAAIVISAVF
ncbi:MAG: sodium-independent anion transporter, partial [Bacteroidia bacterium]|nr:sodium-independent anion transporter [Bacteroidia bacterium]